MRQVAALLAIMAALGAQPAFAQYPGWDGQGPGRWREPPPEDDDDYTESYEYERRPPQPRNPYANPPAPPGGGWRNGVWSPTHRCMTNAGPGWCWNY